MWKLADLCERDKHILAKIDAWDNGKPYSLAEGKDLAETISTFRYYAGWADKYFGRTIETSEAKLAYTKHEPIGTSIPEPLALCPQPLNIFYVFVAESFRGTIPS